MGRDRVLPLRVDERGALSSSTWTLIFKMCDCLVRVNHIYCQSGHQVLLDIFVRYGNIFLGHDLREIKPTRRFQLLATLQPSLDLSRYLWEPILLILEFTQILVHGFVGALWHKKRWCDLYLGVRLWQI